MSKVFVNVLLVISSTQLGVGPQTAGARWRLDHNTVAVGGAVTVIVDDASPQASALMLRIDNREPVRLVDKIGPALRGHGQTLVLLSHDSFYPETVQGSDDQVIRVRIPPIFGEPGEVKLELEMDGVSWGEQTVRVVEAPAEAQRAIDLLYPTMVRGNQTSAESIVLAYLLNGPTTGVSGPDADTEYGKIKRFLPDVRKHPDWTEIFDMLVGRIEIIRFERSITTRDDDQPIRIKDDIDELPTVPAHVKRCLPMKLTSPFAQAIQDEIRGYETYIRVLDAQRRGEDYQAILSEQARGKP